MSELQVVAMLWNKRLDVAGIVGQREQRLAECRADLIHLDTPI
jgi:hypothetical protein